MVSALRSDPQTSEEEHFKLMLVQTEMERVKYLVRSYVRTRLHKVRHVMLFGSIWSDWKQIEKFSYHITLSPELHNLLSGAELSHAQRYNNLAKSISCPGWYYPYVDTRNCFIRIFSTLFSTVYPNLSGDWTRLTATGHQWVRYLSMPEKKGAKAIFKWQNRTSRFRYSFMCGKIAERST